MKNQDFNPIADALSKSVKKSLIKYSDSLATTDAGAVLRFVARFLPVEMIIKLAAHKVAPQQ